MEVVYALSHPSDRLEDERAGHVVRPRQLVAGLRSLGHGVTTHEAAGTRSAAAAARSYWTLRSLVPARAALPARDAARLVQNLRFGRRLADAVARRRPDFVLETQVAFSTAGARAARAAEVPLVLDDVSPVEEDEEVYDVSLRRLARRRRRQTLRSADLVVVTSAAIRRSVVAEGVPEDRVLVLPNGIPESALVVDPAARERRRSAGFADDDVVVAYAGSFQPFHRVGLLVDALARPEAPGRLRLLLVGDGDERAQVEEQVHRLGLAGRVHFAGRVPSDEVSRRLQEADVAVLPATADYTNPMKLYDYLAAGLPVVAPRQAAVLDVVGSAPATYFPPGDTAALARALADLAPSRARLREIGDTSRRFAADQTWSARAAGLVDAVRALPTARR